MTRSFRSTSILAIALLHLTTLALTAQIPSNTAYVGLLSTVGNNTKTRMVGFDAQGTVTTIASFTGPTPVRFEQVPGQNALVIWGPTGVTVYDMATGATRVTTLAPNKGLDWGYVDEDLGMVWNVFGTVCKADDLRGTNTRVLTSLQNNSGEGTWDGTTGGFAALLRSGFSNDIAFFDRGGNMKTRTFASISPSGLSWNPWRGDILMSQIANAPQRDLRHVSHQGTWTPVAHRDGPLFGMTYSAEVLHQPAEAYLCVKSLSNPEYVFNVGASGAATTITPYRAGFLDIFVDVIALGEKSLWGAGAWKTGQPGRMVVDFGPSEAGQRYQTALSFGHRPGISLGARGTAHVAADDLFRLSLQNVPGLFADLSGTLDANGKPERAPTVHLPALQQLSGVRVFASCVVVGPAGVRRVSNAWGITID